MPSAREPDRQLSNVSMETVATGLEGIVVDIAQPAEAIDGIDRPSVVWLAHRAKLALGRCSTKARSAKPSDHVAANRRSRDCCDH